MDLIKLPAGRSWISVRLGSAQRGGTHGVVAVLDMARWTWPDGHGCGLVVFSLCCSQEAPASSCCCPSGTEPPVQAQGEVSQQPSVT